MRIKRAYAHTFPIPAYATDGAGGIDLYSTLQSVCYSHVPTLLPTGWIFEIPPNYVGLIRDRSGTAKQGLSVRAGVVDSDYRGEIKVMLFNESSEIHVVQPGHRIAQILIIPCSQLVLEEVDDLDTTLRGANGFGSTGV